MEPSPFMKLIVLSIIKVLLFWYVYKHLLLNKEYTGLLNLDDDDQLLVQNMNEDDDAEETAELLKDLFPDFSYAKRKRKPKKE